MDKPLLILRFFEILSSMEGFFFFFITSAM